jgi:hypothetical protein
MSRRKSMAIRKPSGRRSFRAQVQLPPASETRRVRDLVLAGVRPAEWGTMLGRLYMEEKISALQYSAGKRWTTLVGDYTQACHGPKPPQTARLDPSGGTPPDPDSLKGVREARRHARVIEDYVGAHRMLQLAGTTSERIVRAVCEEDQAPVGVMELDALRIGLQTLVSWWSSKPNRPKPSRSKPREQKPKG